MGSGLPQFGFPRRFAIDCLSLTEGYFFVDRPRTGGLGSAVCPEATLASILEIFYSKINTKMELQTRYLKILK
jgi:hypothetical protein